MMCISLANLLFAVFFPCNSTSPLGKRYSVCPTDVCYKVTQFRQHLEAAEGESTATGPLDNKFLPFCIIKNEWDGWAALNSCQPPLNSPSVLKQSPLCSIAFPFPASRKHLQAVLLLFSKSP